MPESIAPPVALPKELSLPFKNISSHFRVTVFDPTKGWAGKSSKGNPDAERNCTAAGRGGEPDVRSHTKLSSASSVIRTSALAILVACLTLVSGAAPAQAATNAIQAYTFARSFLNEGQLSQGNTNAALGIEPGSGNLIVANGDYQEIQIFSPDATFSDPPLAVFAQNEAVRTIAVDPGTGEVYGLVQSRNQAPVRELVRYKRSGPLAYSLDPTYKGSLEADAEFGGFAFDPVTGDLFVLYNYPNSAKVVQLGPDGKPVASFGLPAHATNITFSPNGSLFCSVETKVLRFSDSGVLLGSFNSPTTVGTLSYDPNNGTIEVVGVSNSGTYFIEGFSEGGERLFVEETPVSGGAVSAAANPVNGSLYWFTWTGSGALYELTPATYPGVGTPIVSAIGTGSAHIEATVDPGAGPPPNSSVRFEYTSDPKAGWQEAGGQPVGAPGTFEADLEGLEPNQTYQVRAVAANEDLADVSASATFKTVSVAPLVVTGTALEISESGVTFTGSINPVGEQTTYHFEYGTTTAYGSRAPGAVELPAGNGRVARTVSRAVGGLQPLTVYHYRLVATNVLGETTYGSDMSLTTAASASLVTRGYEQVSPVEKGAGTIDTLLGFIGATDSQVSYAIRSSSGGEGAPVFGRAFSQRGPAGWEYGGLTDPSMTVPTETVFDSTLGLSPDMSKALVVTNRALAPGGIEGNANLYLVDTRTRAYTFVATSGAREALISFTGTSTQNKFMGGNSDFSSVIFGSSVPLLPNVSGTAIYRWSVAGGLELESITEGGDLPASSSAMLPTWYGTLRNVSEDGHRVYYGLNGPKQGREDEAVGVYLREGGASKALTVSRRAGDPSTPVYGEFLGSSSDGRFAFFASAAPLLEGAASTPGGIYRYDAVTEDLIYTGGLLTEFGSGNSAGYTALGTSTDGSTLYFASDNGTEVWRNGELHTVTSRHNIGEITVSPSGRYASYNKGEWLTQTTNTFAIMVYDADTGQTVCASCAPDGSNPGGAVLPEYEHTTGNTTPQNFDEQGDLFFDTYSSILPADTNGVKDVYEFSHEGKLRLISPGDAPYAAHFGEVSASGQNVYFTTAQGLVSQDVDQATDVYDARVGGGIPSQNPPPEARCEGESCSQSSSAAPPPPTNGSEGSSGSPPPKAKKKKAKGPVCLKPKGKTKAHCSKKHPHHHKQGNQKGRKS